MIFRFLLTIGLSLVIRDASLAAAIIYDNGLPDPDGGLSAREMTKYIQADDFTLTAASRLESVKFWDYEKNATFSGSIFWQIYSNGPDNSPGALLMSGTSSSMTHIATGYNFLGYDEYVTTFNITPIALQPGVYWFAMHNGQLTETFGYVFWESTNTLGVNPSQGQGLIPPDAGIWFSHAFPGYLSEFAFQLNGVLEPHVTTIASNSGNPRISFTTVAGQFYRVDYKNNLTDPSWNTVSGSENVPGTGGVVQIIDHEVNMGTPSRRFYRVILL